MVGAQSGGNLRQVSHLHRDSVSGWAPSTSWLRSPTFLSAVVIGVLTFVLRLLYATTAPTDLDGIQYVVGSSRFDVRHAAPDPPGSWLYVAAGHVLHLATGMSAVTSLVVLAALASGAAAALTCVAGTALGGRFVGIAAGAFVASAPVSWFAGSTVSTYSIDAFLAALLIVLARRARPYRAHGLLAVGVLGLGAGVRLSALLIFAPLALIAVMGSVRTVGQLLATFATGLASLAAWFVPTIAIQPGGLTAWLHAMHVLISQSAHQSSVFVAPAAGVTTNIGTFGGWTILSIGPVIAVGVLATLVLAGARLVTRQRSGNVSLRIWSRAVEPTDRIERPWYQSTGVILGAALVPALAFVTLGQFTTGGDVLAYLVPATVLFLLPVARLLHHRAWGLRRVAVIVTVVLMVGAVGANVQRFVTAPGLLPADVVSNHTSVWLSQFRYQAPYPDTEAEIHDAEHTAASIAGLRAVVRPATDVVLCIASQKGVVVSRTISRVLPDIRVAVVDPLQSMVFGGLVYVMHSSNLAVGPGGHALVLTLGPSPHLAALAAVGLATETTTKVDDFHVWRVSPGATVLGVTITAVSGPRPLGLPLD
jgi:hypothetical protein